MQRRIPATRKGILAMVEDALVRLKVARMFHELDPGPRTRRRLDRAHADLDWAVRVCMAPTSPPLDRGEAPS